MALGRGTLTFPWWMIQCEMKGTLTSWRGKHFLSLIRSNPITGSRKVLSWWKSACLEVSETSHNRTLTLLGFLIRIVLGIYGCPQSRMVWGWLDGYTYDTSGSPTCFSVAPNWQKQVSRDENSRGLYEISWDYPTSNNKCPWKGTISKEKACLPTIIFRSERLQ